MLLRHPDRPDSGLRLAYCLNLRAATSVAEVLADLEALIVPLRERLLPDGVFGVGMYVPGRLAAHLASRAGSADRAALGAFLARRRLEPFTWNAFPYGDFQTDGLKERVFEPTWAEPERRRFTADVAALAAELCPTGPGAARHVSVSTHAGAHASRATAGEFRERCADGLAAATADLAALERRTGRRVVLGVEPEPRSTANDTPEWAAARAALVAGRPDLAAAAERHLGTCLDACHAAVEFEDPDAALGAATEARTPLAKLQFTSALALERPSESAPARAALFALDEPRFLHQVTGRTASGLARYPDLPALRAAWEAGDPSARGADQWRCHFHVPVDLARFGTAGLATTRAAADALLDRALASPERWGTDELHLEIETYTWDVLADAPSGPEARVDGLEREYHSVLAHLARAGWHPS